MLNAAEAQIYAAAEDDKAAERARAELYAPPRGESRAQAREAGRPAPARRGMSMAEVQAMMSAVAQQDAQITSRRSS